MLKHNHISKETFKDTSKLCNLFYFNLSTSLRNVIFYLSTILARKNMHIRMFSVIYTR